MKRILLSFVLVASFAYVSKLNAQACAVTNTVISNISTNTGPGGCTITFDLQFDLSSNSGNKYAAIYIYSGNLPANFYKSNGRTVPTTSEINAVANILATVQLSTDVSTTVTLANYTSGGSVGNPTSYRAGLNYSKTSLGSGLDRFSFQGITVTVPDCSMQQILKADVGAANASSFNTFSCLNTINFVANDPILRGQLNCGNPFSFTFAALTTASTTITFSAYSDAAHTQLLTAPAGFTYSGYGTASPITITTYQNITLNSTANTSTSFGSFTYNAPMGSKNPVYLVIQAGNVTTNTNMLTIENQCSPLPVSFRSFTAVRNKSNVAIKWVTATEQNSKGFYIQRNTKGTWEDVALVFSAAHEGNSTSDLSYSFNDLNNEKGISQYRILQFDFDGKAKASDTRSVRGEAMASKLLVYPNPSMDGKVSVVFEEGGALKNIIVSDMSGRLVKQYRNISTNNLSIEGLENGVYSIQVIDLSSAAMSVEKIVIKKR